MGVLVTFGLAAGCGKSAESPDGGSGTITITGDGAVGGDGLGDPGGPASCGAVLFQQAPSGFGGYFLASSNLEVDALAIYWIDSDGRVLRLPKSGGAPQVLAVQENGVLGTNAKNVALGADAVYFVDSDQGVGVIQRVSKSGGPITTLARTDITVDMLQLDATSIYFRTRWVAGSPVWSVPIDGGEPIPLASSIDLSATPSMTYLAADDDHLYFTMDAVATSNGGAVYRAGKTGNTVTVLATGVDQPWQLTASDADFLYFDVGDNPYDVATQEFHVGKIGRIPKNATSPPTPEIVATNQVGPKQIVRDGANLYWINFGGTTPDGEADTTIMKLAAPPAGQAAGSTSPVQLGACTSGSQELAVDDTSVYYLDWHGNLRKLAK